MTVVSCAEIFSDSTIRSAITFLSLVIPTVVPRSGDEVTLDFGVVLAEAITCAVGVAAALGVAAKISSLRIRPPTPVPLIVAKFTPASAANFLTMGVTYASSGLEVITAGAGFCAT